MSVLARKSEPGPVLRSEPEEPEAEGALLARVAAGEAQAFRGLLDRHLPTVLAIATRTPKDDPEAEHLAPEAMVRLCRNAGGPAPAPGGVRPSARRVASSLCHDRVRAGRRTSVVDELPEQAEPAGQVRHLSERELKGRVDLALKALPERQRLALTLFHYEGMSQIEVGQVLGISDEAVESLLARARRSLKAALKDEWHGLLPENES